MAIRKQRQADNAAYDILRMTLNVHLDILQRMDDVFGNEIPTQKARDSLHQVVIDAQMVITNYENLMLNIGVAEYSAKFATLAEKFQVCVSALMLYVSFTVQERCQIHRNFDPPPPPAAGEVGDRRPAIFTLVREDKPADLPPAIVKAVLTLTKYESMLEELCNDHQSDRPSV